MGPTHVTATPRRTRTARRFVTAVGAAVASGAVLTACAGGSTAEPVREERAAEPVEGGVISYAHYQEPPCIYGGWVQQAYLSRQVLDSLVSQVDDGEIVPWLATEWTVSDDQLVWTFALADGVTFTDGTPLDAQAVVDNFEYWIHAQGNSTVLAHIGAYYESSRAVDARTFELTLSKPFAPLLSVLSQAYFGIQSPTALERGVEANCDDPIGSGPFIVESWNRGDRVTFVRNPDYTSAPANAKHDGPAYVDGIEWRFVPDGTARFGALTTGEADVIYDVPTPHWELASQQYGVQQYITPGRPVALGLNTVDGPFADVRVRQAFAYGTDRRSAVESAFAGVIPFEGNGSLSQSTPGYAADVAEHYAYDPDRAAALLEEAGWSETDEDGYRVKDGRRLEVRLVYGAGSTITAEGATVLENVQHQAAEVGFLVELVPVTRDQLFSGAYSEPDSYDAKPGYWTSPSASVLHITFRQHLPESPNFSNSSFYNNPELEEVIVEANSTLDRTERDRLYHEAQRIISEDAASIGLYVQTTSLATAPYLRDVWLEASQGEPVFHDAWFDR